MFSQTVKGGTTMRYCFVLLPIFFAATISAAPANAKPKKRPPDGTAANPLPTMSSLPPDGAGVFVSGVGCAKVTHEDPPRGIMLVQFFQKNKTGVGFIPLDLKEPWVRIETGGAKREGAPKDVAKKSLEDRSLRVTVSGCPELEKSLQTNNK